MELDPSASGDDEDDEELQKSSVTRKEIIKDILSTHLGMDVSGGGINGSDNNDKMGSGSGSLAYTTAYFLGVHEVRFFGEVGRRTDFWGGGGDEMDFFIFIFFFVCRRN